MQSLLTTAALALALAAALPAAADSVHLRDGRVLTGEFLGATARTLHLRTAGQIRRLSLSDVARLELDARPQEGAPAAAAPPPGQDARVVILGTGAAQVIEVEPVVR